MVANFAIRLNDRAVQEFWNHVTSDLVLPFSLLLIPFAVYWAIFAFGFIDFDVDADLDVDTADTDGTSSDAGFFHTTVVGVLRFLNATDVPIMLVLSLIALLMWFYSMLLAIFAGSWSIPFQGATFALIATLGAVLTTKILTRPLRPLFQFLKAAEPPDPIVGKSGTVRSRELSATGGQVEVMHRGSDSLLNARLPAEAPPVPRGTEVLVYDYDEPTGIFLVRPIHSSSPTL